jgi:hypothetical protein
MSSVNSLYYHTRISASAPTIDIAAATIVYITHLARWLANVRNGGTNGLPGLQASSDDSGYVFPFSHLYYTASRSLCTRMEKDGRWDAERPSHFISFHDPAAYTFRLRLLLCLLLYLFTVTFTVIVILPILLPSVPLSFIIISIIIIIIIIDIGDRHPGILQTIFCCWSASILSSGTQIQHEFWSLRKLRDSLAELNRKRHSPNGITEQ